MLKAADLKGLPRIEGARVHILQSKWHATQTDCMTQKAYEVLKAAGAEDVVVHIMPGCLEFPYAAKELLSEDAGIDAIIAIGVIVRGDTRHFETVNDECARGLSDLSLEFRRPILNAILPVYEMQAAVERGSDDENNKGIEAALAAVEIIAWRKDL